MLLEGQVSLGKTAKRGRQSNIVHLLRETAKTWSGDRLRFSDGTIAVYNRSDVRWCISDGTQDTSTHVLKTLRVAIMVRVQWLRGFVQDAKDHSLVLNGVLAKRVVHRSTEPPFHNFR